MQTQTVTLDSSTFTAYELSLNDLRTWYSNVAMPGGTCDVVNEIAVPDIGLDDLALMLHCEVSDLDQLTYRELVQLSAAAKEVNPHFFRMRAMITETMRMINEAVSNGFPPVAEQVA